MTEKWAKIQNNEVPWPPGTRLRLHFNCIGSTYITAAQIAYAEKQLEKKKEFTVIGHSLPAQDGWISSFYYEVEVREPTIDPETQQASIGVAVAYIASAIIAVFFMWLALDYGEVKVAQATGEMAESVSAAAEPIKDISKSILAIAAVIALAIITGWIK